MSKIIGYARISTETQDLSGQLDRLEKYGCEKIFKDVQSGKITSREEFNKCLDYLRERDTLVVTRLDRLGRTTKQLFELLQIFIQKEIKFVSLDEKIDITSPMGKMLFNMCSMMAEMEANAIAERTKSGLAAARSRGRFGGRPSKISDEEKKVFIAMASDTTIPVKIIMDRFGISRSTYQKYCRDLGITYKAPESKKKLAFEQYKKMMEGEQNEKNV